MLQITIPSVELWNEITMEFITSEETTLELEHSLVSLSKWESKWHKSFISRKELTDEEVLDYIKCMTLTQNVNPEVYNYLTADNIEQINKYIEAPMTATTFSDNKNGKTSREIVTAEVIYHWMIALNIPFECQYWHLNRLITQIRVCEIKNTPPKKKSAKETARQYAALNAARKKKLGTRG